ncbi:1-deoxy-D-xylulose-5-phosphate reductoisomerase [Peptococcus simiae]|uniref:1-deoxy-D-xylulose 5-phosphate reductoisomerase n=1 Tax=Peptococcus simiae TaxID=1643805 RepID=A0ABW9H009_9FIRM
MTNIAVLGATGSIGQQTLQVVDEHPSLFSISVLAGYHNGALLRDQALKYRPQAVFITDAATYKSLQAELTQAGITVLDSWDQLAAFLADVDIVLGAISGAAGIEPTLIALKLGKTVALANKETLVAAGDLVAEALAKYGGRIIPVDSEHSAIFQCLEANGQPAKILLTASGGPFRHWAKDKLVGIRPADALSHPTWDMGRKITIDSATLMNKGLEVIEAVRLFDMPGEKIQVLVHEESVVHSMVQWVDGTVMAQLGTADMRLPIQYALAWPKRLENTFPTLDLAAIGTLHFAEPRWEDFPALNLAYKALDRGGIIPAVLNAANEVAVDQFLKEKIGFLTIAEVVATTMQAFQAEGVESLAQLQAIDAEARAKALTICAGDGL